MRPEPTIDLDALPATHRSSRSRNRQGLEETRASVPDHLVVKIAAGIVLGWVAVSVIKFMLATLAVGTALAVFS